MSQYRTGTVTVVPANATVTGAGTLWLTEAGIGDLFIPDADGAVYTIAGVSTDTSIQLSAPYAGAFPVAGGSYVIHRDFTPVKGLPMMQEGDLETVSLYNILAMAVDAL